MSDRKKLDPSHLKQGNIRHDSLSSEMIDGIKAIFDVIGPYLDTTLEQFEIDFMWDQNPQVEIAI